MVPPLITIMAAAMGGGGEYPPPSVSTLDPQWMESRVGTSMQGPNNGDGKGPSIVEFLGRWTHLSVTITLLIFLWGQYEAFQTYRRESERTMTINTERISQLQRTNEIQDREFTAAMVVLTTRVDLHRELIVKLQQQLTDHTIADEKRTHR